MTVDIDETSKPKTKKLTSTKASITPDKAKTQKTMVAKGSRENPNLRSAKNLTQSNDLQTKTVSKKAKTPIKHAPKSTVPVAKLSLSVSKDQEPLLKAKNTQSKTKISA